MSNYVYGWDALCSAVLVSVNVFAVGVVVGMCLSRGLHTGRWSLKP